MRCGRHDLRILPEVTDPGVGDFCMTGIEQGDFIPPAAVLHAEAAERLVAHATACYPRECCGLLFGRTGTDGVPEILSVLAERNTASDGGLKSFAADPLSVFLHEQEMARRGQRLLGCYHSHPDVPAVLSDADMQYMIPGMLYLVAAVFAGGSREPVIRWRLWQRRDAASPPEEGSLRRLTPEDDSLLPWSRE